ncbi:hypothetical protein L596_017850 [Steinernema carpocapsae]|nr:hypothetical protein L596_017850 [Steinernema carpocapsae]
MWECFLNPVVKLSLKARISASYQMDAADVGLKLKDETSYVSKMIFNPISGIFHFSLLDFFKSVRVFSFQVRTGSERYEPLLHPLAPRLVDFSMGFNKVLRPHCKLVGCTSTRISPNS